MAAGVVIDTTGNPWKLTYTSNTSIGGGSTLPATVIGAQNTGGIAYGFMPKRLRWVCGTAAAGDQVILKDVPANGGTAREIFNFITTGSDLEFEQRPRAHELYVGLQVTTFASGVLYIYL